MLGTPPADALRADPEPAYPKAALAETEAGREAERQFNDDVLTWGRGLKMQVDRLCRWTARAGAKLPFACPPTPEPPPVK